MPQDNTISTGVQNLINRLRDDGVDEGKKQADEITYRAREEATKILAQAKAEASNIIKEAREIIDFEKKSSEEALKLAARDTILSLSSEVRNRFAQKVKHMVSDQIADRELLKKVVLVVAGKTAAALPKNTEAEILLTDEPASKHKAAFESLEKFIKGINAELLRDGITLHSAEGDPGLHIKLVDKNIDIQLTAETLGDLLTSRIQSKFRHLMIGVALQD